MSHSTNNKTSGFFSSLKENYTQKFANVTITLDKDGNTDDDTLIHNAFVKYFDQKQEPYPDWLGVAQRNNATGSNGSSVSTGPNGTYSTTTPKNNMYSQFQPVESTNRYNNSYQQQQQNQAQQIQQQQLPQQSSPEKPSYGRKSSLQALHDKSRQQVVPGSGYTSGTPSQYSPRPNGYSTTGSRLREKMYARER